MLRCYREHRAVRWHEGKVGRSFISRTTEDSDQTVVFQTEKEDIRVV